MPDESQKTEILLAALEERYESLRTIRERVQTVGLAMIGLLLAAAGWLVQSDESFEGEEKAALIMGVLISVATLRVVYLADLQRGFQTQQRVSARIEKALGFYEAGAFDDAEDTLYPAAWSKAGQEGAEGRFFKTAYLMIYIGSAILVASIALFA